MREINEQDINFILLMGNGFQIFSKITIRAMIHKVLLIDQHSGLGYDLYDDGVLKVDPSLLSGLVGALILFTNSLNEDFEFKKADIGSLTINVSSRYGLQYISFSDSHDNNDYISQKLRSIVTIISPHVSYENLMEFELSEDFQELIDDIVTSEQFPENLIPQTYKYLNYLAENESIIFENLLLADYNYGLIHSFSGDIETASLLLEIMSQIPIENNWTGESSKFIRNGEVVKECLLLSRIENTDYFLLSKSVYKPSMYDEMLDKFNLFKESISAVLEQYYRSL